MTRPTRAVWHLARADFRERSRRYGFILTLAFAAYLGYLVNTGQMALRIGRYQGELTSAWIGVQMALVINTLLGLFGFFLVKNSVERDVTTGVGQILAATPMSGRQYLLGKWCSHFFTLTVMTLVLGAWAVFTQLTRGGAASLDLVALLAPIIVISIPMMALTAGLAVLFESIAWLRGSRGNAVYVVLFNVGLVQVVGIGGRFIPYDPVGFGTIVPPLMEAARARFPDYGGGVTLSVSSHSILGAFPWSGIEWTPSVILAHQAWVVASLALVLAGSLVFTRFDPSAERKRRTVRRSTAAEVEPEAAANPPAAAPAGHGVAGPATLRPAAAWRGLVLGELRLMLRGRPWWWHAVAAGLVVAPWLASEGAVRTGLLPAAWIWPIAAWSGLGSRGMRRGVHAILDSAPRPLSRQLGAAWLAGFVVAVGTGAGIAMRLASTGDVGGLGAWVVGAAFVPSLALGLGTMSGSNRTFETIYALWWYVGPVNRLPALDFMGTTGSAQRPVVYLLLAAGLVAAAVVARKVRLARS
jgi:hypothetical protein